jgi:CRP-like cAMP-binding protein
MLTASQISLLSRSPLFAGLTPEQVSAFFESVGIAPQMAEAGAVLVEQGEVQTTIFTVLSGTAAGEKLTGDGRLVTVNEFHAGDVFVDMLSGSSEKSPVTVRMTSGGELFGIPLSALISGAAEHAALKERVLRNMIYEIAKKFFTLQRRLDLLLIPTLRGKVAEYLLGEEKIRSISFVIPHSREEQARLLSCDRSALSRELSRMKKDGLIDYKGSHFQILDRERLKSNVQ